MFCQQFRSNCQRDSLLAKGIQCSNCVFTQEAEGWSLEKKKINTLLFAIYINIGRDGSEREQEREFNCYTTLKENQILG